MWVGFVTFRFDGRAVVVAGALCGAFPMAFRETLPDLITVSGTTSQGARGGTAALGGRDSTRTPSHAGVCPFLRIRPQNKTDPFTKVTLSFLARLSVPDTPLSASSTTSLRPHLARGRLSPASTPNLDTRDLTASVCKHAGSTTPPGDAAPGKA